LESGLLAKTFGLNFNNQGMMDQSVNCRDRHHVVGKDLMPLAKGLVGRNQQTFALIAMGNEFKEDGGFGFGLFDIAEVIHNQQVEAVQFAEDVGQHQLDFGLLEVLDQSRGTEELNPFALLNGGPSQGGGEMGFSSTIRMPF
jgi:hypothetical protein